MAPLPSVQPKYTQELTRMQTNDQRLQSLINVFEQLDRSLPSPDAFHLLTSLRDRISTYLETSKW